MNANDLSSFEREVHVVGQRAGGHDRRVKVVYCLDIVCARYAYARDEG